MPGGAAIPAGLRARILATAEGNPLFVEEMVRMLVDEGVVTMSGDPAAAVRVADEVRVPPTIGALLAARLDRLPVDERSTAQRASVVGRVFERVAVAALTPPTAEIDLTASLAGLVRRELVTPERSELTADAAFKVPAHPDPRRRLRQAWHKAERAELHEAFRRLARRGRGRPHHGVRGDPRLPPRAGAPLPNRAAGAGRPHSPLGERAAVRLIARRKAGQGSRRSGGSCRAVPAGGGAADRGPTSRRPSCSSLTVSLSWTSAGRPRRLCARTALSRSPARMVTGG